MTRQTTYNELMMIMLDIQTQSNRSITYTMFNKQKIEDFYKRNEVRIGLYNDKYTELVDKYAEKFEGTATPIVLDTPQGPKFKFVTPEEEKAFTDEYLSFLKDPIQLHI